MKNLDVKSSLLVLWPRANGYPILGSLPRLHSRRVPPHQDGCYENRFMYIKQQAGLPPQNRSPINKAIKILGYCNTPVSTAPGSVLETKLSEPIHQTWRQLRCVKPQFPNLHSPRSPGWKLMVAIVPFPAGDRCPPASSNDKTIHHDKLS